ncbi:GNAT family N-acetyltransferase [Oceanirhabdus sp. W0125-5]|uniref:GNAT family N-acetyltransferase n=1 Tax=Oceanirhabdus sp. W0125-5 TaxID=2999116 RepID=UPI0022F2B968|nr:GNAT family N-acetyltransferase [Oceanirhabdus sp. W0125-5]WBW96585.1 GNAT family N-acetyltransferase [Oceanirhabdus sp. W0125-5]
MIIREYEAKDERGWVECRVLSFLDCAYFDNVLREKEHYQNPSIELVAEIDNKIVGLIDIEYETEIGTVCSDGKELGAMIWHIAVLREYRSLGIATQLFNTAIEKLKEKGISLIEAWTRDDKWVNDWYINRGFEWQESYLHIYKTYEDNCTVAKSVIEKLYLCDTFCHYVGEDKEEMKKKFKRVHECSLYKKVI